MCQGRSEELTDDVVVNTGIVANNQGVKVGTEDDEAVWWTSDGVSSSPTGVVVGRNSSLGNRGRSVVTAGCNSWRTWSNFNENIRRVATNLTTNAGLCLSEGLGCRVEGILLVDDLRKLSSNSDVLDIVIEDRASANENAAQLVVSNKDGCRLLSDSTVEVSGHAQ